MLGGVAMYESTENLKEKLRKISFNDLARQPQATDIIHATKQLHVIIYISVFFIILLAIALALITGKI